MNRNKNLFFLGSLIISFILIIILLSNFNKDSSDLKYISKDVEECKLVKFFCVEGMVPFSVDTGCGCEPAKDSNKIYCKPEERNVGACITLYKPVCGQSIKEEPRKIFSNSCVACSDEDVLYYTEGECP